LTSSLWSFTLLCIVVLIVNSNENYFTYLTCDWLRAGRSEDRIPVGRNFPPVQTGPGAHPASCTMGTGSFPGVKCGWGVLLTNYPLLMPRSRKGRAIALLALEAI
jgi:hypothetical protein